MTEYAPGTRVHVEFDGEIIADPLYASRVSSGGCLYDNSSRWGWIEVQADGGPRHVLWVDGAGNNDGLTPLAPPFETGKAYQDASGRVYIRRNDHGDMPWLAPSGIPVSDARPMKPMRKLVPEEA